MCIRDRLKLVLGALEGIINPINRLFQRISNAVEQTIDNISNQEFIFFTKGENIALLNKVMLYIRENEHTKQIKIITVLKEGEPSNETLQKEIEFLDREYPEIDIDFVEETGLFTPELIRNLSHKYNIPINFMFIGSPNETFTYRIEELGGVRLII